MPPKTAPTVLNYTTTIDPVKSATECITRLMHHGARNVTILMDDGEPSGLAFTIDTLYGPRGFALPVNVPGTHKALIAAYNKGRIPRTYTTKEQANRVSWRVIKDWLEAQLALIEAGVAEMSQVMLPYMVVDEVMGDDGPRQITVWDNYVDKQLAIEAPR